MDVAEVATLPAGRCLSNADFLQIMAIFALAIHVTDRVLTAWTVTKHFFYDMKGPEKRPWVSFVSTDSGTFIGCFVAIAIARDAWVPYNWVDENIYECLKFFL